MSIEQRFGEKNEEVPGPGNYNVSNKLQLTKKTHGNFVESFNSTEARFKPAQEV